MISVRTRSDEVVCVDHATLKRRGELPDGAGLSIGGKFIFYSYTKTCFEGRRQWLTCPKCQTPRRVLYSKKFWCRECLQLLYASQFETPLGSAINRALRIRRKLGAPGGLAAPFPMKPKLMRWRTYRGLRTRELALTANCLAKVRSS